MTLDCIHARGSGIFIEPDASFGRRCMCVHAHEQGAHSNSNSPFSLPAREIVNSGKTFMLPGIVCFSQFSEVLRCFRNGKVQGSPTQLISRATSCLDCQTTVEQNIASHLSKGSLSAKLFQYGVFYHTDRCVDKEKKKKNNGGLSWTCGKILRVSSPSSLLSSSTKNLFGRTS